MADCAANARSGAGGKEPNDSYSQSQSQSQSQQSASPFGWYMPAEWAPHRRTFMLMPFRADNWRAGAIPAQRAFLRVALAISRFEEVVVGVAPQLLHTLPELLRALLSEEYPHVSPTPATAVAPADTADTAHTGSADTDTGTANKGVSVERPWLVRMVPMHYDDCWVRDSGCTFLLRRPEGAGTEVETALKPPQYAEQQNEQNTEQNTEQNQHNALLAVDWQFNAWGGKYDSWARDDAVAQELRRLVDCAGQRGQRGQRDSGDGSDETYPFPSMLGYETGGTEGTGTCIGGAETSRGTGVETGGPDPRCALHRADFVLEGGSIHTDGEGTILATEECLLNPNRNPLLSREDIEARLKTHLGAERVIWIPLGLEADHDTDGHVDNFCCFSKPGQVLLAWCDAEADDAAAGDTDDAADDDTDDAGDAAAGGVGGGGGGGATSPPPPTSTATDGMRHRCQTAYDVLSRSVDARGRLLEVVKLPLPRPMYYTEAECDLVPTATTTTATATTTVTTTATTTHPTHPIHKGQTEGQENGGYSRTPQTRLAASYANFYLCNGGLVVPRYG
ncbi:hypothetical protein B484DRAFT_80325 [Ochromonadaceae sp. CCMP2298]|nr:hypothetical protein B484DRAFT_80325 [Ochromonadaceae sp. CCMP2298]